MSEEDTADGLLFHGPFNIGFIPGLHGMAWLHRAGEGFDRSVAHRTSRGVGDDDASYGIDGDRVQKWYRGSARFGEGWEDGDVIGCAADLQAGKLLFSLNGKYGAPMGCAFEGVDPGEGGLYPALTGGHGMRVSVNFGERSVECPLEWLATPL